MICCCGLCSLDITVSWNPSVTINDVGNVQRRQPVVREFSVTDNAYTGADALTQGGAFQDLLIPGLS